MLIKIQSIRRGAVSRRVVDQIIAQNQAEADAARLQELLASAQTLTESMFNATELRTTDLRARFEQLGCTDLPLHIKS